MNAKGRKPMGPRLVHHLAGSELAKQRLEVILETIAGGLPIREACERLGISEARFYQLRTTVLEAGLSCLEPRPAGRPPQVESLDAARVAELTEQLEDAQWERQAAEVRAVIAQTLPQLQSDERVKKTTDRRRRRKALENKYKQRRRKPR
jgi:transposase